MLTARQSKERNITESSTRLPNEKNITSDKFSTITTQLNYLSELFHEKIQHDAVKDDLFKRLYQELSNYREDFIFNNITKRLFVDVIHLYDHLDAVLQQKTLGEKALMEHFERFRTEINQTLRRHGIHRIKEQTGKPFDESCQDARGTISIYRPEQDQIVLEVLKAGFRYREKILRPEEVIVGKYERNEENV